MPPMVATCLLQGIGTCLPQGPSHKRGLSAAARIASTTDAAGIILWMDAPGNASYATQIFSPEGVYKLLQQANILSLAINTLL